MEYQGKEVHRGNIVTVHVSVRGLVTEVSKTTCDVQVVQGDRTVTYRCTLSEDGNELIGSPLKG
ncbi:hypothetical protein GCM10025859_64790 [Alicyclobacillus fastidiosus]|nr:hypothetical protein GCM10025859_64790 [Alicyclobacillus fastidiosus]